MFLRGHFAIELYGTLPIPFHLPSKVHLGMKRFKSRIQPDLPDSAPRSIEQCQGVLKIFALLEDIASRPTAGWAMHSH